MLSNEQLEQTKAYILEYTECSRKIRELKGKMDIYNATSKIKMEYKSEISKLVERKGEIENAVQKEFNMSVRELRDTVREQEKLTITRHDRPASPGRGRELSFEEQSQPPANADQSSHEPTKDLAWGIDPNKKSEREQKEQSEQKKTEPTQESLVSETFSVTQPSHAIPARYTEGINKFYEKQKQQGQDPPQPRHSRGRDY